MLHDLVSVAVLRRIVEDSTRASAVVLRHLLLPDLEVETVLRVVVFPLLPLVHVALTGVLASDFEVLVVLVSFLDSGPGEPKAEVNRVSDGQVILIKNQVGEGKRLGSVPFEEEGILLRFTNGSLVVVDTTL